MTDFLELLASGIRSNSSDVISAVTELASGMAKVLKSSITEMGSYTSSGLESIKSTVSCPIR